MLRWKKLRRMAKASSVAKDAATDVLEDDEHVKQRCQVVVKCGGLEVLSMALRMGDSRGIKVAASKGFLGLTEDKENRGRILQSGGSKALMTFILKTLFLRKTIIRRGAQSGHFRPGGHPSRDKARYHCPADGRIWTW